MKRSDSIALLPGVGKQTLARLNMRGVYTVDQLLAFTGTIIGVNAAKLKQTAKERLRTAKEISSNWSGLVCHLMRKGGKVTRVKIGNLIIADHRIVVSVSWRQNGQRRRKSVSPILLLTAQCLWTARDIVSDDSDADAERPVREFLPKLQVEGAKLLPEELKALRSVIKEIHQFRACVFHNDDAWDGSSEGTA